MENTIKCIVCGIGHSNVTTSFCSDICFEIWWMQQETALLLAWIELELKLADAKPC